MKGYKAERNGAYGPGFFQADLRAGYRFRLGPAPALNAFADLFNVTESRELRQPDAATRPSPTFLVLTALQHELHAAQAAARRAVRVLDVHEADGLADGSAVVGLSSSSSSVRTELRNADAADVRRARYTQERCVPPFRRLLPFLARYRREFVLGLVCVVVTTDPAAVALGAEVRDRRSDRRRDARASSRFYAALLLGIACVGAVFRFLMRQILIGASRDIEYDIRNAFFARLQQMPLGYYQARRTGDLMSRATNDLNAVRMMIGPAVMYSANTILVFVVAIVLMLSIDARLTLMALLPLPLVSISVRYFGSAIHKRFEAIQEQLADLSAVVQEALAGVRVVRAYSQEAHEIERFRAANREYVRRNRVLIRLQGLFFPSMTLFLGFGSLLVLWLAAAHVIRGEHHPRRVRRLQRLPGDAQLADDRVRLGHQHPAARHGVVEADAGGARRRPGHRATGT